MIAQGPDRGMCKVEGQESLLVRLEREMSLNGQSYEIHHQNKKVETLQRERQSKSMRKRKRMTDGSANDYVVGLTVNHHIEKDLQDGQKYRLNGKQ